MSRVDEIYRSFVIDHDLERAELFACLGARFGAGTVLYPGCFVHLTPSFFYPQVVYVDRSEASRAFFANAADVEALASRHKRYAGRPTIRFVAADYEHPLPLGDERFDLLLALYAPNVVGPCKQWVRSGGLLVTNDHRDDAGVAARDPDWQLVAVAHERPFRLDESGLDTYFVPKSKRVRRPAGQPIPSFTEYEKTAPYYVFRRR